MHGILLKVIEITIKYKQQLKITPFCHMLCLGMHSNVMHRFMVQAFQDPTLCTVAAFNCAFF
jgi:hypothetical protein